MCRLDFRPNRFFAAQMEQVVVEFFSSNEPSLAHMPHAFAELIKGTVRPDLDERVTVEAVFSEGRAHAQVTITLLYRLPTVDPHATHQMLVLLLRHATRSGYYRFGSGDAWSLRGSTLVRTRVTEQSAGESIISTTVTFSLHAVASHLKISEGRSAQARGLPPHPRQ